MRGLCPRATNHLIPERTGLISALHRIIHVILTNPQIFAGSASQGEARGVLSTNMFCHLKDLNDFAMNHESSKVGVVDNDIPGNLPNSSTVLPNQQMNVTQPRPKALDLFWERV
jgi:hypothetical protein